ncbi:MAG: threonine synthase [Halobacteriales archaeon]
METTDAFAGLACRDCGERFEPGGATRGCPDCSGTLEAAYDDGEIDLSRAAIESAAGGSIWAFDPLLPFPRSRGVTIAEGGTPLVDCPDLAEELGVGEVVLKDEGRNPTGSIADRGISVAVTAAREAGADTVALPSTGNAGQSAAAYAARAGLDAQVFLPSRANFAGKAMVNVHGGEMSVVEGRFGDAAAAFRDAVAGADWYPVAAAETPYPVEGAKTAAYELFAGLDWRVPEAVVVPTGQGIDLVGIREGARDLERLGLIEAVPPLYAAQASGCAPIVAAVEAGEDEHEPVEYPDTICGALEVPDPAAGALVLDAIRESGGGAVASDDDEILEAATAMAARAGVEPDVACGAAASGARALTERGDLDPDATVVLVNTATGNKEADVLRSHLMSKGI